MSLVPLNERATNIIKHYNNSLFVQEYDALGKPLSIAPNGKQGIFCVSPDFSWRGWFVLDDDVRFTVEQRELDGIIKGMKD